MINNGRFGGNMDFHDGTESDELGTMGKIVFILFIILIILFFVFKELGI